MSTIERAVERAIECCNNELAIYQNMIKVLPLLKGVSDTFELLSGSILIRVSNLDELHLVRLGLKEALGSWKDTLGSIWYGSGSGSMIAEYSSRSFPIVIWLSTKPEEFPKELQSDKCRVVKLPPQVVEDYAYVCDGED